LTHDQERQLFAAAIAVTKISLQLAGMSAEHRASLTSRHRDMLRDASENFEAAAKILAELVRSSPRLPIPMTDNYAEWDDLT